MKLALDTKSIRNKIVKISMVYKLIFILCFNGLIFGFFAYFMIIPQVDTKKNLAREYQEIKRNLDRLVAIKNNLPKTKIEYAQLKEILRQTLNQLPDTKDIPNLLRNISSVGSENGLKVRYFEPKAIQNKEFYGEVPFEIRYSGGFHNIALFFDGIRRLERIIDVTSFTLEAPSKSDTRNLVLQGKATAKTYVYLRDEQRAKKDSKKDVKSGSTSK